MAAAEGETNSTGNSYIFLFDMQEIKMVNKLTFHQKGVQAMSFAGKDKLISSSSVTKLSISSKNPSSASRILRK